jgi:hypothetical protein
MQDSIRRHGPCTILFSYCQIGTQWSGLLLREQVYIHARLVN